MSLININELENDNNKRSFVIIYNFNNKEIMTLKNVFKLFQIKDTQILTTKNSESVISDIIDNNINTSDTDGINQKALIFNNVDATKMSMAIDGLKKFRINRPLIAVVTKESINWSLNKLIMNLVEERNMLRQGKVNKH